MRVRILSRASDLARLQAMLVSRALQDRWPDVDPVLLTRAAAGDRDGETPLAALPDKGAFTADLSEALGAGAADLVVHSWKDLPLEGRPDTTIAATLERADPRDLLLMRLDAVARRPRIVHVLSSSPRRAWLLEQALPGLLPWPVDEIRCAPVRGNVPTRLARLLEGRGDALVVAKAAIDRLLGFGPPFEDAAARVRRVLTDCAWMVLPLRDVPGAPAQGALAVEAAAASHGALRDRLHALSHQPTWDAVTLERHILGAHGGGCHEAVGATVLPREYGRVVSVRAHTAVGQDEQWTLVDAGSAPPRVSAAKIWPRPEERHDARRHALEVAQPEGATGFWVARAEALPERWSVAPGRLVWAAGGTTWRRLAARGVWVHGGAEGLGDAEAPGVDLLAGRRVDWQRLTHAAAAEPGALATYVVAETLPDDLPNRSHFFWTSGRLLVEALERWPEIGHGWHGSGPGRTWRALREALPSTDRARVWLDYAHWHQEVIA
jgi:hydroxymethylbilane synthase